MKRLWTTASVVPQPGGFGVQLDNKLLRIVDGPPLQVPSRPLADAIAAEWHLAGAENGGTMSYADVPLTRLAGTAQLRIAPDPAPSAAAIAAYGETDLLCYRADDPPKLRQQQDAAWQPWLDWTNDRFGAELAVTTGILHIKQSPASLARMRQAVDSLDPWLLGGLGIVVPALGSLVLGLAVAMRDLPIVEAHALSRLDEAFQAALWGEDAEAELRRLDIAADLDQAARFMALLA